MRNREKNVIPAKAGSTNKLNKIPALAWITCILLVSALPAHAAITIGALTQLCSFDAQGKELAPSAHASCQSYIAGIVDYQELFKSVGKTSASIDFCLPETLTYTDIQRVVLDYLQAHSTFTNSPASSAVAIALHNEYPCNGESPLQGVVPPSAAPAGDTQSDVSPEMNSDDMQAPDMSASSDSLTDGATQ